MKPASTAAKSAAQPPDATVKPAAKDGTAAPPVLARTPQEEEAAAAEARRRREEVNNSLFPEDPDLATAGEDRDFGKSVFGTFLALGLTILIAYVTLKFGLARLMGVRVPSAGSAKLVKVIARVPLEPKKSLFVIEVAGEYLLVGGADNGLNLITKLDTEQVERLERERAASPGPALSPFLQKLLSRRGGPPPAAGQGG